MLKSAVLLTFIVSQSYYPKQQHVWVRVTKPFLGCFNTMLGYGDNYDEKAKTLMQTGIARWINHRTVPSGCSTIKVGTEIELSVEQPPDAIRFIEYCFGCAPNISTLYGPTESLYGEYLTPTETPTRFRGN